MPDARYVQPNLEINPTSSSWGDKYEVCPKPKTGPPPPSPQDVGLLARSWDFRDPPFCGLNFASMTRHWTRDLWEGSIKILPRVEVWAETIWNRRKDSDHCRQSTWHLLMRSKLLVHMSFQASFFLFLFGGKKKERGWRWVCLQQQVQMQNWAASKLLAGQKL